jgi:hypothetical protein
VQKDCFVSILDGLTLKSKALRSFAKSTQINILAELNLEKRDFKKIKISQIEMCNEIVKQINLIATNGFSNAKSARILLPHLALASETRLMSPFKGTNVVFNTTNKINQ